MATRCPRPRGIADVRPAACRHRAADKPAWCGTMGLLLANLLLATPAVAATAPAVTAQTQFLRLVIGGDGRVAEFVDRQTGRNYAAQPPGRCRFVRRDRPDVAGHPATRRRRPMADGLRRLGRPAGTAAPGPGSLSGVAGGRGPRRGCGTAGVPGPAAGAAGHAEEPFAACALALNLKTNVVELPRPSSRLRATCYPKFGCAGAAVALVACPSAELRAALQEAVSAAPGTASFAAGRPLGAGRADQPRLVSVQLRRHHRRERGRVD